MKKPNRFIGKLSLILSLYIFIIMVFTLLAITSAIMFLYHMDIITLRTPFIYLIFIASAGIIIATILSKYISKNFIQSIETISEASQEVAKGNFNVVLPENHYIEEIKTMTQNFNKMIRELGKNEIQSMQFINNVSHEFKTPVSAIEGYATLLQNNKLDDAKRKDYAQRIMHSTKRLSSLTTDILVLSRLNHKEDTIIGDPFELDEQIREVILSLESQWSTKNIDLLPELEPLTYCGNEQLLILVWENLLTNAIKFVDKKGLIDVKLYEDESSVIFTIKDNGIGITPQAQAHVFEEFYQEDTSHTTPGNGLGLSLVHKIIALHKGSIAMYSQKDEGTEITIRLPKQGEKENEKTN